MNEEWVKWEPIPYLAEKYYITSILNAVDEGFVITLSGYKKEKNKVRVIFWNSVDCYRSTDESFRLKTIDELNNKYGSNFYTNWTFFKVINSSYIAWLSEQSYGLINESFIHFSFIELDSILDVVTTYEPKVELIVE